MWWDFRIIDRGPPFMKVLHRQTASSPDTRTRHACTLKAAEVPDMLSYLPMGAPDGEAPSCLWLGSGSITGILSSCRPSSSESRCRGQEVTTEGPTVGQAGRVCC